MKVRIPKNVVARECREFDMLSVGEIYPQHKTYEDKVFLSVDSNGLMLYFVYRHPASIEISEFHNCQPKFALVEDSNIQLFMCEFGKISWQASAYNYYADMPEKLESVPNILTCLMFDSCTGKLVAMRVLALDPKFVNRLVEGINNQREIPISRTEFSEKVEEMWLKYPTNRKLLQKAHCKYDFSTGKIH